MGFFQARILEWVAISFSRGSSQPRDQTHVTCLLHWQAGSSPLASPGKPPHVLGKTKQNKKELISSLAHHNCEERCGSWSLHPPNKPCPLAYLLLFFTQIKSFSKNNPLLLSQVSDGSFVYRANHFANTPLSSPLIYFPSHHSSSTGKSYIWFICWSLSSSPCTPLGERDFFILAITVSLWSRKEPSAYRYLINTCWLLNTSIDESISCSSHFTFHIGFSVF